MKKLFIAVLSMATLASCFQSEFAVDQAIDFNTYVGSTTKAIDPSIDNTSIKTKKFYVWGTTQQNITGAPIVPIFAEEEVSYSNGEWNYDVNNTKYWIAGNKYNFAAVVNGNVTSLDKGLPKTIDYIADGVTDLLYDRSAQDITRESNNSKAVAFTFDHLLSKAVFTFTNTSDDKEGNLYVVENIQISGLGKSATYDVTTGWGAWTYDPAYVVDFGNIVETATNAGADAVAVSNVPLKSNYERLLIPGSYTIKITCTISLYLNGIYDAANPLVNRGQLINYEKEFDVTLAPGTAYNFALSAGLNEEIDFAVNPINEWANGNIADSDSDGENDQYPIL